MRSPPCSKISPQKKPRRRYNHAKKSEMILKMESASTRQLEAETGIPNSNLARWKQQADAILNVEGNMKRFHFHGAGRPNCIPDSEGLEIFMHKRRDAEKALTCTHLVNFLKRNN
ncbi:hypothetical protein DYB26_016097 [Aphanomyces astaci]|uniref:Uncharacterized protein n=1 Tax=Aphanomyces astaci TaxID=112090 RepID=A0A397FX31_APHAT|nr:hypothetical protein DYB26_016097 [Aphanomyces astaci]RHZ39867.1 hypothetical protein DYB31_016652 [Aphanomyces astaci]